MNNFCGLWLPIPGSAQSQAGWGWGSFKGPSNPNCAVTLWLYHICIYVHRQHMHVSVCDYTNINWQAINTEPQITFKSKNILGLPGLLNSGYKPTLHRQFCHCIFHHNPTFWLPNLLSCFQFYVLTFMPRRIRSAIQRKTRKSLHGRPGHSAHDYHQLIQSASFRNSFLVLNATFLLLIKMCKSLSLLQKEPYSKTTEQTFGFDILDIIQETGNFTAISI